MAKTVFVGDTPYRVILTSEIFSDDQGRKYPCEVDQEEKIIFVSNLASRKQRKAAIRAARKMLLKSDPNASVSSAV